MFHHLPGIKLRYFSSLLVYFSDYRSAEKKITKSLFLAPYKRTLKHFQQATLLFLFCCSAVYCSSLGYTEQFMSRVRPKNLSSATKLSQKFGSLFVKQLRSSQFLFAWNLQLYSWEKMIYVMCSNELLGVPKWNTLGGPVQPMWKR